MIANHENNFKIDLDKSAMLETYWNLFKQFDKHDVDEFIIAISLVDINGKTHSYSFEAKANQVRENLNSVAIENLFAIGKEHDSKEVQCRVIFKKTTLNDINMKDDFYGKAE
jgi:hypothetical protein